MGARYAFVAQMQHPLVREHPNTPTQVLNVNLKKLFGRKISQFGRNISQNGRFFSHIFSPITTLQIGYLPIWEKDVMQNKNTRCQYF